MANARIVLNAQPSMPLCQMNVLGQTQLVLFFRTAPELNTLLTTLTSVTEISLWVDSQTAAWQVIENARVRRFWVNGNASHQPGSDELIAVEEGQIQSVPTSSGVDKTNTALFPQLDALRNAQRPWAVQGNKKLLLVKFLMQLMNDSQLSAQKGINFTHSYLILISFIIILLYASLVSLLGQLLQLVRFVQLASKGLVVENPAKEVLTFDLSDPVGVIAVLADEPSSPISVINLVTLALLKGNASVVLCSSQLLQPIVQSIVK